MIRRVTSRQTAHHTGRHALTVALMLMTLCLLVGASAATAAGSQDQPAVSVDSPWLPWLGCWQLVEETGTLAEHKAENADSITAIGSRGKAKQTHASKPIQFLFPV